MLCEHCKMREATVRYVEVINGVKTEHNLCTQCAGQVDMGQYSSLFDGEFPLGKLLSGLLSIQGGGEKTQYSGVVCPVCGTTYEECVKDSFFGCQDCYSVFGPLMGENIRRLQGSEKHVGKRPKNRIFEEEDAAVSGEETKDGVSLTKEEERRFLEGKLKEAVRMEEFEEAARLRDRLRELKKEMDNEEMV